MNYFEESALGLLFWISPLIRPLIGLLILADSSSAPNHLSLPLTFAYRATRYLATSLPSPLAASNRLRCHPNPNQLGRQLVNVVQLLRSYRAKHSSQNLMKMYQRLRQCRNLRPQSVVVSIGTRTCLGQSVYSTTSRATLICATNFFSDSTRNAKEENRQKAVSKTAKGLLYGKIAEAVFSVDGDAETRTDYAANPAKYTKAVDNYINQ